MRLLDRVMAGESRRQASSDRGFIPCGKQCIGNLDKLTGDGVFLSASSGYPLLLTRTRN